MSIVELKTAIQELIQQEDKLEVLQAVKALLDEASELEYAQRQDMIETAKASSEDIKAGRVLTPDQVALRSRAYWEKG